MQYQIGSVSVTNGSNIVQGTGTKWQTDGDPIQAGDEFCVIGDLTFYQVASVESDTQLTLVENYVGTTAAGKTYYILRDWTSLGLPVLQRGDVDVANVIGRLTRKIDQVVGANTGAITIPINVGDGGTGTTVLRQGALVIGSGANPMRALAVLGLGSLLIGAGGTGDPVDLPIGADGQTLLVDSAQPNKVKWGVITAPTSIGGVRNDQGDIVLSHGGAITIATDNVAKTITISETHSTRTDNPHAVTKAQIGLGSVTNDAQLKIVSNLADLADKVASRTNLGLGSMALQNASTVAITGGTIAGITSADFSGTVKLDTLDAHTASGAVTVSATGGLSVTHDAAVGGNLTVTGNLTVAGTVTTTSTNNVQVGDNIMTLNSGLPSTSAPTLDAGFEVNRGTGATVQWLWDEASDYFRPKFADGTKAALGGVLAPTQGYHVGDRDYNDLRYTLRSNNLSDLADKAAALTNLSGVSTTTFTGHTSNTSNPHAVTAAQVGAIVGLKVGATNLDSAGGRITLAGSGRISVAGVGTTATISTTAEANTLADMDTVSGYSWIGTKTGEALGVKRVKAAGPITISDDGNYLTITATTVPDGSSLRIDNADTTSDYLAAKLVQGNGISMTVGNVGADENLTVALSGSYTGDFSFSGGKVGIGVAPGSAALLVNAPDAATPAILAQPFGNGTGLKITSSGAPAATLISLSDQSNNPTITATKTTGAGLANSASYLLQLTGNYAHNGAVGEGTGLSVSVSSSNTVTTGVPTLTGAVISATSNAAGTTAVGLQVSAQSASGNAYAALFPAGKVGINLATPTALLHVAAAENAATDPLRLRDTTNGADARFYFTTPIGAGSDLNIGAGRVIVPGIFRASNIELLAGVNSNNNSITWNAIGELKLQSSLNVTTFLHAGGGFDTTLTAFNPATAATNAKNLNLLGGVPTDGNGGSVIITAGNGVGTDRSGGNVVITPGTATGTGTPGTVQFAGGKVLVGYTADQGGGQLLQVNGGALINGAATFTGALTGVPGRLINVQIFTGNATYTPTAGTNTIIVEVQGGGGAAGGRPATGSGQDSIGGAGGGGGYAWARMANPGPQIITVGLGGSGVAGGTGNSGGTSSFGSLVSATGGTGGLASLAGGASNADGGSGGSGSGGNLNLFGHSGGMSWYIANQAYVVGRAGDGRFLSSGRGGNGEISGPNSVAAAGASGNNGIVVVWEYA